MSAPGCQPWTMADRSLVVNDKPSVRMYWSVHILLYPRTYGRFVMIPVPSCPVEPAFRPPADILAFQGAETWSRVDNRANGIKQKNMKANLKFKYFKQMSRDGLTNPFCKIRF